MADKASHRLGQIRTQKPGLKTLSMMFYLAMHQKKRHRFNHRDRIAPAQCAHKDRLNELVEVERRIIQYGLI